MSLSKYVVSGRQDARYESVKSLEMSSRGKILSADCCGDGYLVKRENNYIPVRAEDRCAALAFA